MPKPPARCGTTGGYQRHYRLHEPVCEDCRAAQREYIQDYNARRTGRPRSAPSPALTRRLDRQAEREQDDRATRLLAGIRDEQWGTPWWLPRPPEVTI